MNLHFRALCAAVCAGLAVVSSAHAEIRTENVEYRRGDVSFEGYRAWDDSVSGPRPTVLIVHQWKGLTDYEKKRAEMLAKLGYHAFAVDIYGRGVRAKDAAEAGKLAGQYKGDRALLRRRVIAGLEVAKESPFTDHKRIAAIGYCFGGTTVLELARSGADVRGVVSFHGGLNTPTTKDAHNIKARVLTLHGADDPFVPAKEVADFKQEMADGHVDMKFVAYPGAVHSFTDWNAGNDNSRGAAYNERADRESWDEMQKFFKELFAK